MESTTTIVASASVTNGEAQVMPLPKVFWQPLPIIVHKPLNPSDYDGCCKTLLPGQCWVLVFERDPAPLKIATVVQYRPPPTPTHLLVEPEECTEQGVCSLPVAARAPLSQGRVRRRARVFSRDPYTMCGGWAIPTSALVRVRRGGETHLYHVEAYKAERARLRRFAKATRKPKKSQRVVVPPPVLDSEEEFPYLVPVDHLASRDDCDLTARSYIQGGRIGEQRRFTVKRVVTRPSVSRSQVASMKVPMSVDAQWLPTTVLPQTGSTRKSPTPLVSRSEASREEVVTVVGHADREDAHISHGAQSVSVADNAVVEETTTPSVAIPFRPKVLTRANCESLADQDLTSTCDKWIVMDPITWRSSDQRNTVLKHIDFMSDVLSKYKNLSQILPLRNYTYMAFDHLEIKFVLNCPPFVCGFVMAGWFYQNDEDMNADYRLNRFGVSYTNHINLNAASGNQGILTIPYKNTRPYLRVKLYDDTYPNFGRLTLVVLNPLYMPTGSVPTVSITPHVRIVGVRVQGMHSADIGRLPALRGEMFWTIAGYVLRAANALYQEFADQNRDKPPLPDVQHPVQPQMVCLAAGKNVVENLHPMRLDALGQTAHGESPDEMKVDHVASVFGLCSTIMWQSTAATYGFLAKFPAAPMWDVSSYTSLERGGIKGYYLPPVAVLSCMAYGWSGSLKFKFEISATKYVQGRLLVGYCPTVHKDMTVPTADQLKGGLFQEMVLADGVTDFVFEVPYIAQNPIWPRRYGHLADRNFLEYPGWIYLYVLNVLSNTSVAPGTAEINVYLAGGSTFQLHMPITPSLGVLWDSDYKDESSPDKVEIKAIGGVLQLQKPVRSFLTLHTGDNQEVAITGKSAGWYNHTAANRQALQADYNKRRKGATWEIVIDSVRAKPWEILWAVLPDNGSYTTWIPVGTSVNGVDNSGLFYAIFYKFNSETKKWDPRMTTDPRTGKAMFDPDLTKCVSVDAPNWYWAEDFELEFNAVADADDFELVEGHIVEERTMSVKPVTPQTMTMTPQKLLFGELFNDLKDFVRRPFLLKRFALTASGGKPFSLTEPRFVIPCLPQALFLDVDCPLENAGRGGILNLIISGYRYFRGGLRYTFVVECPYPCVLHVQHQPDYPVKSIRMEVSDSPLKGVVFGQGYATAATETQLNASMCVEVPFYVRTEYLLLQEPALYQGTVAQNLDPAYHIGALVGSIGAFIPDKATCSVSVFFSWADDARASTFYGFPPLSVVLLVGAGVASGILLLKSLARLRREIPLYVGGKVLDNVTGLPGSGKVVLSEHTQAARLLQFSRYCLEGRGWRGYIEVALQKIRDAGLLLTDAAMQTLLLAIEFLFQLRESLTAQDCEILGVRGHAWEECNYSQIIAKILTVLTQAVAVTLGVEELSTRMRQADMNKYVLRLVDFVSSIARSTSGLVQFFGLLLDFISWCIDWFAAKWNRRSLLQHVVTDHKDFLNDWMAEVQYLTGGAVAERVFGDPSLTARVVLAARVAEQLRREMVALKSFSHNHSLSVLIEQIRKLRDVAVVRQLRHTCRPQPYVVWLSGVGGIGKSELRDVLVLDMLESRKTEDPIVGNPIYGIQPGAKYWTGVHPNTKAVTFDDFGVNADPSSIASQVETLQRLKSDQIFIPEQAALEEKGRPIAPRIVLALSNFDYFGTHVCPIINQDEAFASRVDARVQVRLRDGYQDCLASNGRIDTAKLLDKFQRVVPNYDTRYVEPAKPCFDHLVFSVMPTVNADSGSWLLKDASYEGFKAWLLPRFKSYCESQDMLVNRKIARLESLMNIDEDSPLKDQWSRIVSDSAVVIAGLAPHKSDAWHKGVLESLTTKYYPSAKNWCAEFLKDVSELLGSWKSEMKIPTWPGHVRGLADRPRQDFPHARAEDLHEVDVEDVPLHDAWGEFGRCWYDPAALLDSFAQCDCVHVRRVRASMDGEDDSTYSFCTRDDKLFMRVRNGWMLTDLIQFPCAPDCIMSWMPLLSEANLRELERAWPKNLYKFVRALRVEYEMNRQAMRVEEEVRKMSVLYRIKTKAADKFHNLKKLFFCDGRVTELTIWILTAGLSLGWLYAARKVASALNKPERDMTEAECRDLIARIEAQRHPAPLPTERITTQQGTVLASVQDHAHAYEPGGRVVRTSKGRQVYFKPKVLTPSKIAGQSFHAISNLGKQFQDATVMVTVSTWIGSTLRRSTMKGFVLCGRTIIVLKHLFPKVNTKTMVTITGKVTEHNPVSVELERISRTDAQNSEYLFLTFPPNNINMGACMVRRFIPLDKTGSMSTRVFAIDVEPVGVVHTTQVNLKQSAANQYRITDQLGDESSVIDTVMTYDWGAPGKCMTPIVTHIDAVYIVGFHCAGSSGLSVTGVAETIMMEDAAQLCQCPKTLTVTGESEMIQDPVEELNSYFLSDPWAQKNPGQDVSIGGVSVSMRSAEVLGVLKPQFACSSKPSTEYVKSALADYMEDSKTRPASLAVTKLYEGIKFHDDPPIPFGRPDVDAFSHQYASHLLLNCKRDALNVRVLSKTEAVKGVIGWPLPAVNSSTSTGFPFVCLDKSAGKRGAFSVDHNGVVTFTPVFDAVYSKRLELRKSGVRPNTVFVDCLKDARVSVDKYAKSGSTRVFSVCSADYLVTFRQYFGCFLASFILSRDRLQHSIGINPDGAEWTALAQRLQSGSAMKWLCGDYSKFGPRLMKEMLLAIKPAILAWYEEHQEDKTNLEEDQRVRGILLDEMVYSVHLANGLLYRTNTGSPSGAPPTAPINSMVNLGYIFCAWMEYCRERNLTQLMSLNAMLTKLVITTYGDDIVIGVRDGMWESFNNLYLQQFFAKHDIKYTDIDKGNTMRPYCDFSEVQFLKRTFLSVPGLNKVLAPIDESVIWDTAYWIRPRSGVTVAEATKQNVEAAQLLAYGHGEKKYNEIRTRLTSLCAKAGITGVTFHDWATIHATLERMQQSESDFVFLDDFESILDRQIQASLAAIHSDRTTFS